MQVVRGHPHPQQQRQHNFPTGKRKGPTESTRVRKQSQQPQQQARRQQQGPRQHRPLVTITLGPGDATNYVQHDERREHEMKKILLNWVDGCRKRKKDEAHVQPLLACLENYNSPSQDQITTLRRDYDIVYLVLNESKMDIIYEVVTDSCSTWFVRKSRHHCWVKHCMNHAVTKCNVEEMCAVLQGQSELVYKRHNGEYRKYDRKKSLKTSRFFYEGQTNVDWEVNQFNWELCDMVKKSPPSYQRVSISSYFNGGFNVNGWLKVRGDRNSFDMGRFYEFVLSDHHDDDRVFSTFKSLINGEEVLRATEKSGDGVEKVENLCNAIIQASKAEIWVYGITDRKYTHHKCKKYKARPLCYSPVAFDLLKANGTEMYQVNAFRVKIINVEECVESMEGDDCLLSYPKPTLVSDGGFRNPFVAHCQTNCVFDLLAFNRGVCEVREPAVKNPRETAPPSNSVLGGNKKRKLEDSSVPTGFEIRKDICAMLDSEDGDDDGYGSMGHSTSYFVPKKAPYVSQGRVTTPSRCFRGVVYNEGLLADLMYVALNLMCFARSPQKNAEHFSKLITYKGHWKSSLFSIVNPLTVPDYGKPITTTTTSRAAGKVWVIRKRELFADLIIREEVCDLVRGSPDPMGSVAVLNCAKRVSVLRKEEGWLLDMVRLYRKILINFDNLAPMEKLRGSVRSALTQALLMNNTYAEYKSGSPLCWSMELGRIITTYHCTGGCKLNSYLKCFQSTTTTGVVSSNSRRRRRPDDDPWGQDHHHHGYNQLEESCRNQIKYEYLGGSERDFCILKDKPHICGWQCSECMETLSNNNLVCEYGDFQDLFSRQYAREDTDWLFMDNALHYPLHVVKENIGWVMDVYRTLMIDLALSEGFTTDTHIAGGGEKGNTTIGGVFQEALKYHYQTFMGEFIDFFNMTGTDTTLESQENQQVFRNYLKRMSNPNQAHPVLILGLFMDVMTTIYSCFSWDTLLTSSGVNVPTTLLGFYLRNYIRHTDSGLDVMYQLLCVEPTLKVMHGNTPVETMINGGYVLVKIVAKFDTMMLRENIYPEEVRIYKLLDTRKDKLYADAPIFDLTKVDLSVGQNLTNVVRCYGKKNHTHQGGKSISLEEYQNKLLNNTAACLEILTNF